MILNGSYGTRRLNGHIDVARLLLEHGFDVNGLDRCCRTPLHIASQQGHTSFLLERGVDVNAKDKSCSTALHLALQERRGVELARLLLEHGADVEVVDDRGRTPLEVASWQQRDEITTLLSELCST